jgi:hypothetical protein
MRRATRGGGTVAAYVWDYAGKMQMMRYFWDAAAALDPAAVELDEGSDFHSAIRNDWSASSETRVCATSKRAQSIRRQYSWTLKTIGGHSSVARRQRRAIVYPYLRSVGARSAKSIRTLLPTTPMEASAPDQC